jgi:hypothetical protein
MCARRRTVVSNSNPSSPGLRYTASAPGHGFAVAAISG